MDRNTEPCQLSITVSDTGQGIKKEAQINLFSPFEQVENIHSGSGLGLSICKELISLMGGSINLQSELNIGTSVYIKLPVSFREVSKPITRDISIPYEKKDIKSLHVLIVDDHPANRLLLSRQLKLMGHSCSEAVNGHDGFTKWKMHEPDIILTDCSMPILNGLEMTKMIRAHNDSIQIIGITADAQEDERLRCIDTGMNYCLFRPVKFNELAMILDTITVGLSIGTINDYKIININIKKKKNKKNKINLK
ncbi:hypothetical protein DP190_23085 [Enterobacter cloacae]|nr:hypothetical protein DP190_23085 [Enterobacter cloacae]